MADSEEPTEQERALAARIVQAEYDLALMLNTPAGTRQHWALAWQAVASLTRLARFTDTAGLAEDGQTSYNERLGLRPDMVEMARQQAKGVL